MDKLRIYCDTSVFGGAFDQEFINESTLFFDQVRADAFKLVVSPLVRDEIVPAPGRVQELYQSMLRIAEMVPYNDDVLRLQEAYLEAKIVPLRWEADGAHVAFATAHQCRIIVSWNFKHIVNYRKIAMYNAVNIKEGFGPIAIHIPPEVIDYEEKRL